MNTCTHPCVIPTADGYVCLSCHERWQQLALIDAPTGTMPITAPEKAGGISASVHSPVASGNSDHRETQLPLFSASTDQPSHSAPHFHKVRVYSSHGKLYYRYTCNVGHEVTHDEHIPGGNVRNAIAKNRATRVKRWIDEGELPETIAQRIREWRAPRRR